MHASIKHTSLYPLLKGLFRYVAAFSLLIAPQLSPAHTISISVGEAVVHRDRIELKISVTADDLLHLYRFYADAQSRFAATDIAQAAEKHKAFLLDTLVIRDADGGRLAGKVLGVELPHLAAGGVSMMELIATTITYRLEYPLDQPPARLSFQRSFGGDAPLMPAIMHLQVAREGLPPEPAVRLTTDENVEIVAFDWNRTSQAATNSFAETGARPVPSGSQELGLPGYSETCTFVYIQNAEVRIEILMPLLTLETWQPVARTNARFVEVSEQLAARRTLETFFTQQNELRIDGVAAKPKLDRLDFYGVDLQDFAVRPTPRRLNALTARVAAILTYSTKGAPGHVELKWTLFNNQMPAARSVIFAYDKSSRFVFYPNSPVFRWEAPDAPKLRPPSAISTNESSREAVVGSLLRNVYRAFDYRSDSDIYDALSGSVGGELLTDFYLKIKQDLVVQEQDGAVARVQKVTIVKAGLAERQGGPGFAARVTWQVEGTVEHWGHIHTRVNEYSADLVIQPFGSFWKIASFIVAHQSQVGSAVILRKL